MLVTEVFVEPDASAARPSASRVLATVHLVAWSADVTTVPMACEASVDKMTVLERTLLIISRAPILHCR